MKLIDSCTGLILELKEATSEILVIEKQEYMESFLGDLWSQCAGGPGDIIVTEGDVILDIKKSLEIFFNPFEININSKKLKKLLFEEMTEIANSEYGMRTLDVTDTIIRYVNEICSRLPYGLTLNDKIRPDSLFKLLDVQFDETGIDLLQRVLEYIKLTAQLESEKLFIFVNMKMYFKDDFMEEIYKTVFNYNSKLLLIESCYTEKTEMEHVTVIDKDGCIISY